MKQSLLQLLTIAFLLLSNSSVYGQTTTTPANSTGSLIQVELIKPDPNALTQSAAAMNEGTNDPTSTGAKMILSGEKAYYVKEYENMVIVQEEIEN